MTREEILILAIGGVVLLVALAVLIYKWIRHRFYEYNECTGRIELKSKIQRESELARKEYEARQEEIARQRAMETGVDLKDPKTFCPRDGHFEDLVFVKVMKMGSKDGRYAIHFHDITYDEDISLFVDEGTYKDTKIGDTGSLCYNFKDKIFYYFQNSDYLFKD